MEAVARLVRSSISASITEEDLFDMNFTLGELYLVQVLGLPRPTKESILRDTKFWDWWINERILTMNKSFLQYLAFWNLSSVSSGEYLFFMEHQVQRQPYYNAAMQVQQLEREHI